jgi:hypothetical protein
VAIAPLFAQQSEKSGLKGTSLLRAPAGPIKLMGKGTNGKGKGKGKGTKGFYSEHALNTLDPDFIFKPNEHDGIYHVKICKSDTVGCYGPPQ